MERFSRDCHYYAFVEIMKYVAYELEILYRFKNRIFFVNYLIVGSILPRFINEQYIIWITNFNSYFRRAILIDIRHVSLKIVISKVAEDLQNLRRLWNKLIWYVGQKF